jgi:hypothetical protein
MGAGVRQGEAAATRTYVGHGTFQRPHDGRGMGMRSLCLALVALLLLACAATNSRGLTLPDARNRALRLERFLTRTQVESLLGLPDETAITPMGGAEGVARWTALQWTYVFVDGFSGTRDQLVVTLEESESGNQAWFVHSWNWY